MEAVQERAVGQLNISCSVASGKYVLPLIATRFRQRFPDVQISIFPCASKDVTRRLLEEKADLALVSSELEDPTFESQTLFFDTIQLIVPPEHDWARRGRISAAELLEEEIIMREPSSGSRKVLLTELAKYDISYDDLNILLEIGNAEGIVTAVAAGCGISFVSQKVIEDAVALGRVKVVEIDDWLITRRVYMVRRAYQSLQRVTEAFWSFVHDPSNQDILSQQKSLSSEHF